MKSQSAWCVCSVILLGSFLSGKGRCWEEESATPDPIITTTMATLGGVRETQGNQNSAEIEELGRFAVQEHNKKQNALLEFGRIVKAKEQVVAGTLHHLTLEVTDAGKKNLYEAKVWVKPWLHFKELQEFTPSDLGAAQGWLMVPANHPLSHDAANHNALKIIQQRPIQLAGRPYEMLEILLTGAKGD